MVASAINVLRDRYSMVKGTGTTLRSQYSALSNRPSGETLIGLAYQIFATEYINLVNSNDRIPFIQISRSGANSVIKLPTTADLNDFIVGRKLILSTGTTTSIDSLVTPPSAAVEAKKHITLVTDTPDQYKELTIEVVDRNLREITLSGSQSITSDFSMSNLTGFTIGFRDKFLIAKGRILI
jgi:hypothetical protein